MSYNALEAFNQQISAQESANEFVCSDRQYVYVNDAMGNSYTSGYINWNSVALVGQDPKKVLNPSSGFALIPYGAVCHLTGTNATFGSSGTAGTLHETDAMLLAPKGVHHIVSQISARMGGITVHQPISHANFFANERLKTMTEDQMRMYADVLGFKWDSSESYELNSAVLEINNRLVASGFTAGMGAAAYANEGHRERIMKNNFDLSSANARLGIGAASNALRNNAGVASTNVLQDVYSPALIGVYDDQGNPITASAAGEYTAGANRTITTLMFQYVAILPLSIISDFYNQMPSVATLSNFELKLLTNLAPSNSWTVGYTGAAAASMTPTSTGSAQSVGETCPFMISPLSSDGTTGCMANGTGLTLTVSPFVGYYNSPPTLSSAGNARRVASNSLQQCQLWIPSVSLTDPYMDLMLSNKQKRILYADYQQDATLTQIAPFATAQRLLTYQVGRLRKLIILPYLSTASAANSANCCDPRQSLISSAPNTCSFAKISNLQVFLGSVNLFSQPQSYDFLHYLNGAYIQQGVVNGNDFKTMSVQGQIRYSDWKRCYGAYVVDLERTADAQTDEIIKNIQISFKNDTPNTYDYLVLIEYQAEVELDRVSGQIIATGSV